ncbi:MAG: DciA family protein [Thermoleophilia bacterium]
MADLKQLGALIGRERDRIWKKSPALELQSLWAEAAGRQIAANTSVQSLRGGILTVSCDSGAWACELRLSAARLVDRINGLQPPEPVREIRFIHKARSG